jgi:hypothetical protein
MASRSHGIVDKVDVNGPSQANADVGSLRISDTAADLRELEIVPSLSYNARLVDGFDLELAYKVLVKGFIRMHYRGINPVDGKRRG